MALRGGDIFLPNGGGPEQHSEAEGGLYPLPTYGVRSYLNHVDQFLDIFDTPQCGPIYCYNVDHFLKFPPFPLAVHMV